jgi:hypothetical protein
MLGRVVGGGRLLGLLLRDLLGRLELLESASSAARAASTGATPSSVSRRMTSRRATSSDVYRR